MKKYQFNEITLLQFILLIHGAQTGVGLLMIPKDLAEASGTDGWMSIILAFFVSTTFCLIVLKTFKNDEDSTIFDLFSKYFGRWIGKGFSGVWIIYFGFSSITILYSAVYIISVWILPQTKDYVILFLFMLPGYLLTRNGLRIIGRFSEFVFFFTLWMPLLLLYNLKDSYWIHLLPLLKNGVYPIFDGIKTTIFSFLGFELVYIFYPFLKDKKYAVHGIIIANLLTTIVLLFVTVMCFIFYSPDEIHTYVWPTISLLKPIEFPFLERLEIIFISFYLFVISTTAIPYIFSTVFGATQLVGLKDHKYILRGLIPIFILMTMLYQATFESVNLLGGLFEKSGFIFAFVFPLFLFLWIKGSRIFKKGVIKK